MSEIRITPAIKELVVVEPASRGQPAVVEIAVPGPQGPPGIAANLNDIGDVTAIDAVDGSLLYYDGGSSTFRADSNVTKTTLTDGGNF
jgi:hypothetical protein